MVSGPTVRGAEILRPGLRTTGHRADAREQLPEAERLHDVVVRAELEPDDAVDLVAARGHDDDRHLGARPQPPAHLEPVDVGQAEIEQHDVVVLRGERRRAGRGAATSRPSRSSPRASGTAIASSSSTISTRTATPSHSAPTAIVHDPLVRILELHGPALERRSLRWTSTTRHPRPEDHTHGSTEEARHRRSGLTHRHGRGHRRSDRAWASSASPTTARTSASSARSTRPTSLDDDTTTSTLRPRGDDAPTTPVTTSATTTASTRPGHDANDDHGDDRVGTTATTTNTVPEANDDHGDNRGRILGLGRRHAVPARRTADRDRPAPVTTATMTDPDLAARAAALAARSGSRPSGRRGRRRHPAAASRIVAAGSERHGAVRPHRRSHAAQLRRRPSPSARPAVARERRRRPSPTPAAVPAAATARLPASRRGAGPAAASADRAGTPTTAATAALRRRRPSAPPPAPSRSTKTS